MRSTKSSFVFWIDVCMIIKILAIGDIVGKIGRRALVALLPDIKKEYDVDLVIANAENIAHGKGFSYETLKEVSDVGVDVFTTGNHMNKKPEGVTVMDTKQMTVIRPYNWAEPGVSVPGEGFVMTEVGGVRIAVVNVIGQAFFKEKYANPFHGFDRALAEIGDDIKVIIVDMHAEATSEKVAFGWHADGRASLVFGTHTHVATADTRVLLDGTGYVTDLGMTGDYNGVIGVAREEAVSQFLTNLSAIYTLKEEGVAQMNAVVASIDTETGKCVHIERVDRIVEVR